MPETRVDRFGMANPQTEASSVGEGEADSATASGPGYLVGGNTNVLTNAQSISVFVEDGNRWTSSGGVTVTQNYANGPGAAGSYATRLQFPQYGIAEMYTIYGQTASTVYTLSFYITATSSGSANSASLLYDDNGVQQSLAAPVFGTWTRVVRRITSDGSGAIGSGGRVLQTNTAGPCDVLVWGAKVELGSTATGSYP